MCLGMNFPPVLAMMILVALLASFMSLESGKEDYFVLEDYSCMSLHSPIIIMVLLIIVRDHPLISRCLLLYSLSSSIIKFRSWVQAAEKDQKNEMTRTDPWFQLQLPSFPVTASSYLHPPPFPHILLPLSLLVMNECSSNTRLEREPLEIKDQELLAVVRTGITHRHRVYKLLKISFSPLFPSLVIYYINFHPKVSKVINNPLIFLDD